MWLINRFNVVYVPAQNTFFQVFFELMQERVIALNHNLYPAVVQVTHKTGYTTDTPGDFLRVPAKTDSLNRTGEIKVQTLLHAHPSLPIRGTNRTPPRFWETMPDFILR